MIGSVVHARQVRFMKRSIVSFEQGSDQICGTELQYLALSGMPSGRRWTPFRMIENMLNFHYF